MISVLILTHNEKLHIERLIKNLSNVSDDICVVDSFSNDGTFEFIKNQKGVQVIQNKWFDYSTQFKFGLKSFSFKNEWVMRMDADEILSLELIEYIQKKLNSEKCNGISINRGVYFDGKKLKWGGYRKVKLTRLFRVGYGDIESRSMDEHIIINGPTKHVNFYLYDHNLNDITWWTNKHVKYAHREATDYLNNNSYKQDLGIANRIRKWKGFYNSTPLIWRVFGYAFYRIILRGGFLDGRGMKFHILQCFWYRLLVDIIILEKQKISNEFK